MMLFPDNGEAVSELVDGLDACFTLVIQLSHLHLFFLSGSMILNLTNVTFAHSRSNVSLHCEQIRNSRLGILCLHLSHVIFVIGLSLDENIFNRYLKRKKTYSGYGRIRSCVLRFGIRRFCRDTAAPL